MKLVSNKKIFFIFLAIYFFSVLANQASAATLVVTNTGDTNDAVCDAHCSLREAVETAAAGDTIIFARELRGGTIQLQNTLQITKRLTIDGPNKRRITVKGNNTFRIFHLLITSGSRVVTLDGLIIRDGFEANSDGGGIYVDPTSSATLNIVNCAILNNTARRGGGVYIFTSGTFYLIDSTVAGNTATGDGSGGGLDLWRTSAQIMNSTISSNRAVSTIDGAGGIRLAGASGFINGSTIAGNSSDGAGSISAGGLISLGGFFGSITNTILAGNAGLNPDFYGSANLRYSLVGITDSRSGFNNGVNGNIVGSVDAPVNPQIGNLAENGGGLPTSALLSTSPAINAGNNVLSINRQGQPLQIDQRSYVRIVNQTVDMGAYEFGSQTFLTTSTVTGQVTAASGRGISGAQVTLRNGSGEVRSAMTNSSGYYRFLNLPADLTYTLEYQRKRNARSAQTVLIEETNEIVDFRLQ